MICNVCGEKLNEYNSHYFDGEYFCNNCFFDEYEYCHSCNLVFRHEDIEWSDNDLPYCPSCWETINVQD